MISCGARLAPFDIPQLREIMSYDELELDRMGDRRTATFFCISDTDSTYNFLVALAFSQMFNLLCERADNVHGGRLPHHVRVLWDEAANTGQVPNLEKTGGGHPLPGDQPVPAISAACPMQGHLR